MSNPYRCSVYSSRPTFLAQACALLLHSGRSRPSSWFFHFQERPLPPACRACSSSLYLVLFQGPQPYLSLNVSSSRTPSLSLTDHLRSSSCDKFSFHLAFISEPSSQFQLNKILSCHMFLPRLQAVTSWFSVVSSLLAKFLEQTRLV